MLNPKYAKAMAELKATGHAEFRVFGNSMTPRIRSGATLHFERALDYNIGDVVFCRVSGRIIDAHLITARGERGWLISNNHGHDNGWTKQIYGKVTKIVKQGK